MISVRTEHRAIFSKEVITFHLNISVFIDDVEVWIVDVSKLSMKVNECLARLELKLDVVAFEIDIQCELV